MWTGRLGWSEVQPPSKKAGSILSLSLKQNRKLHQVSFHVHNKENGEGMQSFWVSAEH